MSLRSIVRRWLLSDTEQQGLAAWAAFVRPEHHLYDQSGTLWDPATPARTDLGWGAGPGSTLGWLQGMHEADNALVINHFAIDKSLTGLGLGTRLAHGLGKAVKAHAGLEYLIFTEYTQSAEHDRFFTVRLGAIRQPCHYDHRRLEWNWKIP